MSQTGFSFPEAAPMPRLSVDLKGPRSPETCQACGAKASPWLLERWRECDDVDHPESIIVVLCPLCAKRLIEPHARLYVPLQRNEPWPGTLDLCVDCRHRQGTACTSPDLLANGGTGVVLTIKAPVICHVRMAKPAASGWRKMWTQSAQSCQQREVTTPCLPVAEPR